MVLRCVSRPCSHVHSRNSALLHVSHLTFCGLSGGTWGREHREHDEKKRDANAKVERWGHVRPAFRSSPLTKEFSWAFLIPQTTVVNGIWMLTKLQLTVVELIFSTVHCFSSFTSTYILSLEEKHWWTSEGRHWSRGETSRSGVLVRGVRWVNESIFSLLTNTNSFCYDSKWSGWSPRGRVELVLPSGSRSSSSWSSQWATEDILARKKGDEESPHFHFKPTECRKSWNSTHDGWKEWGAEYCISTQTRGGSSLPDLFKHPQPHTQSTSFPNPYKYVLSRTAWLSQLSARLPPPFSKFLQMRYSS